MGFEAVMEDDDWKNVLGKNDDVLCRRSFGSYTERVFCDGRKVRPTPLAPPVAATRRNTCVNYTPRLLVPRHVKGCKYIFILLDDVHLIVSIIAVAYPLDPALAVLK